MAYYIVLLSVLMDQLLGEPTRFHPLVGYGRLVLGVENAIYACEVVYKHPFVQRMIGFIALLFVTVPFVSIAWFVVHKTSFSFLFNVIALYASIGAKSLGQHARAVATALQARDIDRARRDVSHIVSRQTSQLDATDIARAAIESVLENGSDAIFGAIFWFVIFGAPGAVLYRLCNTLDAMWGYKNDRYLHFGWAAARIDDVLNFVPARLTALSYMLAGNFMNGARCWRAQARLWYSPNAGPVMATGAGALGVLLGGPARYHGEVKQRPTLGLGASPVAADIERAIHLVQRALLIWLIVIALGGFLLHA